jgi:hypothetical protein
MPCLVPRNGDCNELFAGHNGREILQLRGPWCCVISPGVAAGIFVKRVTAGQATLVALTP